MCELIGVCEHIGVVGTVCVGTLVCVSSWCGGHTGVVGALVSVRW